MKTYYLVPMKAKGPIYDGSLVVRLDDCKKHRAEMEALALEVHLNNGKTQADLWKAYQSGDMRIDPCTQWTVVVQTFAQARGLGSFSQWPCNKDI